MSGRPPEFYCHGAGVDVPVRVCALLEHHVDLAGLRQRLRGADPELDAVLVAIHRGALMWRGSVCGTSMAEGAEPGAGSQWLTSKAAGALLGIGARAVRKAIAADRLPAELHGGSWRISREDAEHYRAARAT